MIHDILTYSEGFFTARAVVFFGGHDVEQKTSTERGEGSAAFGYEKKLGVRPPIVP